MYHRRHGRFGRGEGSGNRRAGFANVVDEISAENDDRYRTCDGPVRAAVRSEPFAQPMVQRVFVVPNDRGAVHLGRSFFVVRVENTLPPESFPKRTNRRVASLIPGKFISSQIRQH